MLSGNSETPVINSCCTCQLFSDQDHMLSSFGLIISLRNRQRCVLLQLDALLLHPFSTPISSSSLARPSTNNWVSCVPSPPNLNSIDVRNRKSGSEGVLFALYFLLYMLVGFVRLRFRETKISPKKVQYMPKTSHENTFGGHFEERR